MSWFKRETEPSVTDWLQAAVKLKADQVVKLRASLKEMIETQDEWERAVGNIIGRRVGVFERAIDQAKKVLEETE